MSDNSRSHNPVDLELAEFVDALLGCAGMVARILDHMESFAAAGYSDPDAPPPHVILEGLFSDILRPVFRNRSRSDVRAAAAVLSEASDALSEEILLVPVEEMERIREED